MNPQLTAPGQAVQPAANNVNPQGVASVNPVAAPVPTKLPSAPANVGLPAPVQNPTYNPSADLQRIASYYKIPQQASLASSAAQTSGEQGRQQFASSSFEAGVKEQNLKDQLDSSKYTVKQDPKGQYGISITNSLGQPVDLSTYVNLTGQNPAQILQNSTDPKAQQFVQAYGNLNNLMQAMLAPKSDKQAQVTLGDFFQANPGLQQMTPQQVTDAFMSQYGEFFGQPQQSQPGSTQGVTSTFASANTPMASSPYYEMQAYPQLQQPNPITASLLGSGNQSTNASSVSNYLNSQLNNGG